jgi:O-antigen ligase
MLVALYFTYTRSLILAATIIIFAPYAISERSSLRKTTIKFALVLCVFTSFLWSFFSSDLTFRELTLNSPSIQKRYGEMTKALNVVAESPLLGKGPGYLLQVRIPEYHLDRRKSYTHNLFSYILIHYGILFFVTILLLLAKLTFTFWRVYKESNNPKAKKTSLANLLGCIGILIYVQFEAIYKSFSFMFSLALLIGFGAQMEQWLVKLKNTGQNIYGSGK